MAKRKAESSPVVTRTAGEKWGIGNLPPKLAPRAAIRLFCLECNGEKIVRPENDCINVQCFIYQHRPWRKYDKDHVIKKRKPRAEAL